MREFKVGLLIIAALAALVVGIFVIGESNNLFARKSRYFVHFETVSGLAEGNPVQLNGVTVGRVDSIELPQEADERLLTVNISLDRRFADRVRTDSEARIKTLGLLGDKYIQLTSGSPDAAATPNGGEILAAEATDVDELIASGENAVDNFVAISVSLREILARMEGGEGILGQLTTDTATGNQARDRTLSILAALEELTTRMQRGEGSLGRLLNDDSLVRRLEGTIGRLEANLATLETGEGALPALLRDPGTKERLDEAITSLNAAATEFSALAVEMREGKGLLPRLLNDEAYGDQVTQDLQAVIDNLGRITERIDSGDGTAAQLINDPEIYDALQDIVVGINESRMLRWLIRNRQKKGIKKRYQDAQDAQEDSATPVAAPPPGTAAQNPAEPQGGYLP